jgi:cellulose synthase/poly-beta-1,6-N-acetylglucosamine synthase-like glycosyltransferase
VPTYTAKFDEAVPLYVRLGPVIEVLFERRINNIPLSMLALLNSALGLLVGILLVPIAFFVLQLVCSLPRHSPQIRKLDRWPKITVLIPAHNEAQVIGETLRQLKSGPAKNCRIVVVAHNCTDGTAEIARRLGTETVILNNSEEWGKGYALAGGVAHLHADPPDIVIVVDADCILSDDAIEHLASVVSEAGLPVQSRYSILPKRSSDMKQKISAFAVTVANYVRPLGLQRLGCSCSLKGSGMAFPWPIIRKSNFGNGDLVEDLRLSIDLARGGIPILFCPEAVTTSYFPTTTNAMMSQRIRWEHGHLQLILWGVPRLIWASLVRRSWGIFASALGLLIPPVTLMTYLLVAALAMTVLAQTLGASPKFAIALLTAAIALFGSILLVWWRYRGDVLPLHGLWAVPLYIAQKFSIYFKLFFDRQTRWVRTDRT